MIHRVYNSTKHSKSHPITFRVGQTGNSQPHVSKRCAAHILTRFFPAIGSGLDIVLSGALITSSKAAVIERDQHTFKDSNHTFEEQMVYSFQFLAKKTSWVIYPPLFQIIPSEQFVFRDEPQEKLDSRGYF
jgi:hypothetical protein